MPAVFVELELQRLRMQRLGQSGYTPEQAARVNREITTRDVYTHSVGIDHDRR